MQTLVLNSGSSSIKFSFFVCDRHEQITDRNEEPTCLLNGELTGIGSDNAILHTSPSQSPISSAVNVMASTVEQAINVVLEAVAASKLEPDAVGYRVVHPGPNLHGHQKITPEVLLLLKEAKAFAPLHDPEALLLITKTMKRFSRVPHYACFDTVFHETMPGEASTYPLPVVYREVGVRRYGFHGLSCESIVHQLRLNHMLPNRLVIAHLGSGCSVTALVDGASVDTTMGLTPTGGVLMGARSGDLDPGLVLYLVRQQGGDREEAIAAVETLLNHSSGIASLSGMPNNVRAVRKAAELGDVHASLSLRVFTRSVTKAIGGFCWLLRGLDAIVFTGGIGEHDSASREEILSGLATLGIELDPTRNSESGQILRAISSDLSRIAVWVVPAMEDLRIAAHVEEMYRSDKKLDHTEANR